MKERFRKRMTIRNRLLLLEVISIAGMIAIGLVAIATSRQINQVSTVIADYWVPSVIAAGELNTQISDYRIGEHNHVLSEKPEDMRLQDGKLAAGRAAVSQAFEEFSGRYAGDGDAELVNTARLLWTQYLECSDEILERSRAGEPEEALRLLKGNSQRYFDEMGAILSTVADAKQDGAEAASEYGNHLYRRLVEWKILMIVMLGIVLSLLVVSLIRGIVRPLNTVAGGLNRAAAGDLDVHLKCGGGNEIQNMARAVNTLTENLRRMTADEKRMFEEIGNGNLDAETRSESAYQGDFASILYGVKNMESRLKAQKKTEEKKENS